MGSRLVATRRWLIDSIRVLPAFADAQVDYAWRANTDAQTRVFTNRAEATHTPSGLKSGRVFRNEAGSFDLVILHYGIDTEPMETAEYAVSLAELVEDWVADNRMPAVDGVNWLRAGGMTVDDLHTDAGGFLVEVSLRVVYDARLT